MKKLVGLLIFIVLGCSETELVSTWKNPDIVIFNANKVLVVGMTPNTQSRQNFESRMVEKFEERGVEAMRSIDLFDVSFTSSARSEAELEIFEEQLLDKDFDAILFTKILGSETRQTLARKLSDLDRHNGRFKDDYLRHQNIYYDDEYYKQFTVYIVETSLYCICVEKEMELIWRGVLEIPDPIEAERTIEEYIDLVKSALEEEDIIFRKDA
jgi:hypothetical protein